ncbi:MAG: CarD family transcriptional regulator [Rickettsiales bacterium]|nr:CarD family transcriptional regulator [Rickettsiales bacterium]
MTKKSFSINDYVVYPSHGVGQITAINNQDIVGQKVEFYIIHFEKEKMQLSVPVARAEKIGLRQLCSERDVEKSFDIISEKAQTSRGIMWSRRAQEYERKINSGDIFSVAEVIRDLHRNVKNPDRSYSERMIYEAAFNRFVSEASLIKKQDITVFEEEFYKMLKIDDVIEMDDLNQFDEIDNFDEESNNNSEDDDDDDDDDLIAA